MNPLNELRKALEAIEFYEMKIMHGQSAAAEIMDRGEVLAALDAFAAAHHGLVDLTLCGPQCPSSKTWPWGETTCFVLKGLVAPLGKPCPVLAQKEA